MSNETDSARRGPFLIKLLLFCVILGILAGSLFYFWKDISDFFDRFQKLISDNDRVSAYINSFGPAAPLIFISFQILQVIFAPIPGEATGFIGGYIFGVLPGFFYSSIGLTIGSLANLLIGRLLGKRVVRKVISQRRMERFDRILKRQGVIVFFILFIIPGFPKDYLCLFLGLSKVSLKVLILIAAVGRIPGTLLLSIQGAYLFERNYPLFFLVLGLCGVIGWVSYKYKEKIYRWVESFNGN